MPDSEKNPKEMKSTLKWAKASILIGAAVFAVLIIFWIAPYLKYAV